MSVGLDWPGMVRAGLQRLCLTPDVFWRLTPAELRLMLGEGGQGGRLTRAGLEALAARFPDVRKDER
jgi:uncharacterized phage protein (TIGR02216 family)